MKGSIASAPVKWRLGGAIAAALAAVLAAMALLGAPPARADFPTRCSSNSSPVRDPSNPLALREPPGPDPLTGARFFVDGPAHGLAAGAIASMLGLDSASLQAVPWTSLFWDMVLGPLSIRFHSNPGRAWEIAQLSKIAFEPETKRFSNSTAGGGPGAVYGNAQKFLCRMHAMDPGAVPLIETYFLKHTAPCHTMRETPPDKAVFRRHVDELAAALGRFPFVMFVELDAVTTAGCLGRAGLADRIELLKYEVDAFAGLPHGVVYVEGGVSDADSTGLVARILNRIDIRRIRGFYLNATHYQWTINEIRFGQRVSKLTHGAHFIVGTQDNGQGPLLNRDPAHHGIENLCNPPGRGLGPRPTTSTGFRHVDAFEWISTPGRSGGRCHPGDPDSGLFGVDLALHYAFYANERLGPGYPSRPY